MHLRLRGPYAADATAARTWVADGATSEEHAAALLKNRLYRRWGIKTARVCASRRG